MAKLRMPRPLTLAISCLVLGALFLLLGIGLATWWAKDRTVTISTYDSATEAYVATQPGVLSLWPGEVTVAVESGEKPFVAVVGRTHDVKAWLGKEPYNVATRASSFHTLALEVSRASHLTSIAQRRSEVGTLPEAAPSPEKSDMWVARMKGTGRGEFKWTPPPGQWSLLLMGDGKNPAPRLSLAWQVPTKNPWIPFVVIGLLTLTLSAVLLTREQLLRRRQVKSRRALHSRSRASAAEDAIVTTAIAVGTGEEPAPQDTPPTGRHRDLRSRLADSSQSAGRRAEQSRARLSEKLPRKWQRRNESAGERGSEGDKK